MKNLKYFLQVLIASTTSVVRFSSLQLINKPAQFCGIIAILYLEYKLHSHYTHDITLVLLASVFLVVRIISLNGARDFTLLAYTLVVGTLATLGPYLLNDRHIVVVLDVLHVGTLAAIFYFVPAATFHKSSKL